MINRIDTRLHSKEVLPLTLPTKKAPERLIFMAARKRALTGLETAELVEAGRERSRRRIERDAIERDAAESSLDEAQLQRLLDQQHVVAEYGRQQKMQELRQRDEAGANSDDELTRFDSGMFAEGDVGAASPAVSAAEESQLMTENPPKALSLADTTASESSDDSDSSNETFPSPRKVASQPQPPTFTSTATTAAPPATAPEFRPSRARKPTAKQASQERRALAAKAAKSAKYAKKPKLVDTSQNAYNGLPFRSSQ